MYLICITACARGAGPHHAHNENPRQLPAGG
jgi:hypothetical protein